MVDLLNRTLSAAEVKKLYEPAVKSYAGNPQALSFADSRSSAATWILDRLK
jgi:hypothetical protein